MLDSEGKESSCFNKNASPLWGVDDEKEVRRIQEVAWRKIPLGKRVGIYFVVFFSVSFLMVVIMKSLNLSASWIRGAISGLIGTQLFFFLMQRRLRKHLPETLTAEGRCPNCGYDLKNHAGDVCPECGQKDNRDGT